MCKNKLFFLCSFLILLIVGCSDAGKSQVVSSNEEVILNGIKSENSVMQRVKSYKWKQTTGKKVLLQNDDMVTSSFIAPIVSEKTKLVFKLTTVECLRRLPCIESSDNVIITVLPK